MHMTLGEILLVLAFLILLGGITSGNGRGRVHHKGPPPDGPPPEAPPPPPPLKTQRGCGCNCHRDR